MKYEEDIDSNTRETIVKGLFVWPGSKARLAKHILEHIPYREKYVEPFGGSGVVLLSRHRSQVEVFNDRHSGITDFYKCVRDPDKMTKLKERLDLTVQSREEFLDCRDTWENTTDIIERAARWYYSVQYSFAGLGRNFGRSLTALSGRIPDYLHHFPVVHERLKRVIIENMDFEQLMLDCDSTQTVFYCDPPYLDTYDAYSNKMKLEDHYRLLQTIFKCRGPVVLSGYANHIYDEYDWDETHTFETLGLMKPTKGTDNNNNIQNEDGKRPMATEKLWIKKGY